MNHTVFRSLAVAFLALAVTSCASDKKIAFCPGMTSILDTAMATQFAPGVTPDAKNAIYTVKIADVKGTCTFDKQGKASDSDVTVSFAATRAAPGDAAQYTVPYFVAVTMANRVVTKQLRSASFSFEAGATVANFQDEISSVALVTDTDKKPYDYQILVGLQLTKAQLDYNRSVGLFNQ